MTVGRPVPYDRLPLQLADVERVAVFRALHLGDFLCSVPALRALKDRFPGAELTYIGLPWAREIVERYRYVDRFLEFPGYCGLEGVASRPKVVHEFLDEARAYRYDLAIQMHGDGRVSNGFVAQLGARVSLGYRRRSVELPKELDVELEMDDGEHEVLRWLRLVGALGAVGTVEIEFPLTPGDRTEAESVLAESGVAPADLVVVLHPGAKEATKRWPAIGFARVGDSLSEQVGARVLITGSRDEMDVARAVASEMREPARVVAGRTSLGGLAALLGRAQLLVTNDTGPSHLAAAIGVPSVVLFGPTEPGRWAPLGVAAHRALWSGPGNPIAFIPVERVLDESLGLVRQCVHPTS